MGTSLAGAHLSSHKGSSYAGNGVLACHVLRGQEAELDAPLLQCLQATISCGNLTFRLLPRVHGLFWPKPWPLLFHGVIWQKDSLRVNSIVAICAAIDEKTVGPQLLITLHTPCHHSLSAAVHVPVAHTAHQERVLHRGMYDSVEAIMAWHIDSYEKLKPYDFIIHGCVDNIYTTAACVT